MPHIQIAQSDAEISRCFAVMSQLRPNLVADEFVERVRRQQREGYQLAFLEDGGEVKAVAGFRLMEMLSRGRFMYVDDLVTNADDRSKGHGDALFDWLADYARAALCEAMNLDSGVQRFGAHRFYLRKRMNIVAHHFSLKL